VSETYSGRDTKKTYLFEGDTKIDVNEFSCRFVDEDIGDVTVSESENVTDHRGCCDTPRVVESHLEPKRRYLLSFPEEVAHDRRHLLQQPVESRELQLPLGVRVDSFRLDRSQLGTGVLHHSGRADLTVWRMNSSQRGSYGTARGEIEL